MISKSSNALSQLTEAIVPASIFPLETEDGEEPKPANNPKNTGLSLLLKLTETAEEDTSHMHTQTNG